VAFDPQKIRMIFFDAAGTLFNVRGNLGQIYSDTMARYGARMSSATAEIRFKQAFATAPRPMFLRPLR
jgi:putative hydrolase of the HAD superfamily